MSKSTFYCLAFLALAAPSWVSAGPQAQLRQLEKDFNAAYAANDLDKYFSYYTDDAIFWFPEGLTDLPGYKKSWTAEIAAGTKIQAGILSDFHLKFSPRGDSAIASYLLHLKTLQANQKVSDEVFQETDIWFKTADNWKITHVHYAPAATAAPAQK